MEVLYEREWIEPATPVPPTEQEAGITEEIAAVALKPNQPSQGSLPANALFVAAQAPRVGAVSHWRWSFTAGTVAGGVGMSTVRNFAPGWVFKQYQQLACGNFATNGALRRGGFAAGHQPPSRVDWYIERPTPTALKIYSAVNGDPQPATIEMNFQHAATVDALKPTVSWELDKGTGATPTKATLKVFRQVPIPQGPRAYEHAHTHRSNPVGTWVFDDPDYFESTLIVGEDGFIGVRASNCMGLPVQLHDVHSRERSGAVSSDPNTPVTTTFMMPLGPMFEVENRIKNEWVRNPGSRWELHNNRLKIGDLTFSEKLQGPVVIDADSNELEL